MSTEHAQKISRPVGEPGGPKSTTTTTDTSIIPRLPEKFTPLTRAELAAALHPATAAAERDGYANGFSDGYMQAWAEALVEYGTVEARIEAPARRFYLLEANDVDHGGVR